MRCLGFEPVVAGWKVQTNPLSYVGIPSHHFSCFGLRIEEEQDVEGEGGQNILQKGKPFARYLPKNYG